jgi:hypothetical protein
MAPRGAAGSIRYLRAIGAPSPEMRAGPARTGPALRVLRNSARHGWPPRLSARQAAANAEQRRNRANSWVSQESKLETGLGGWGARIRTGEWRNQLRRGRGHDRRSHLSHRETEVEVVLVTDPRGRSGEANPVAKSGNGRHAGGSAGSVQKAL